MTAGWRCGSMRAARDGFRCDPEAVFIWQGPAGDPRMSIDSQGLQGFLAIRALEAEERRVEMLQAALLERQRLRHEILKLNETERRGGGGRLAELQRQLEEERKRQEEEARREAERLEQSGWRGNGLKRNGWRARQRLPGQPRKRGWQRRPARLRKPERPRRQIAAEAEAAGRQKRRASPKKPVWRRKRRARRRSPFGGGSRGAKQAEEARRAEEARQAEEAERAAQVDGGQGNPLPRPEAPVNQNARTAGEDEGAPISILPPRERPLLRFRFNEPIQLPRTQF